ncbi:MAG: prepilin peptidase [Ruminococcaceae bacterium]|nr:prepilin peptidase [Oscillospiraceae bacterium]
MPTKVVLGLLYFLVFMTGACIGSFYNVITIRVPLKESFVKGRSHCMECGHQLTAFDLVPFFSYVFLCGKCRYCKTKISIRYPLMELIGGLSALFSVHRLGFTLEALLVFYIISVLITLSVIDQQTMEIPDQFHIAILVAVVASFFMGPKISFFSRLAGFFIISIPMLIIANLTGGGFGGGDIKLMAVAGALLGWKATLCAFMVGIFSASFYCIYILLYALIRVVQKKVPSFKEGMTAAMKMPFAFGPYLSFGIVVAYLYSDTLISFYLGMFSL